MAVFRYILCSPTLWPVTPLQGGGTPVVRADAGVCRGPPPLALTPINLNVKLIELYAHICPAVVPLMASRGRQFPRMTLLVEAGGGGVLFSRRVSALGPEGSSASLSEQ